MKPVTAINLECIPEKEYLSPEFQLIPESKSSGIFIYESTNPSVFIIDQDAIVTITGPGRAYVIIRQLESDDFAANQIDRLIVVNKSKPPITFLGPEILLLTETSLSTEILKIETVVELIKNVFSTNENVLEIIEILPNEYKLIPRYLGKSSVTVLTKSNYYFDSSIAHFEIEVLENLESLSDKPLLLNIKVFGENFKHNALKDVDILTSNKSLEVKDNNLQLSFQQQTRGYNYDVPILNLAADKFIDNVATYNREILCCTPVGNLNFSVNWDFGNNIIFDYFPHEGNVNDLPRINIFRSDGQYIEYMSGGFNFLKIPQNSGPDDPNVYTYQKWGNRNAGTRKFTVPEVECLNFDNILGLYYGVDFFTTEELQPIVLNPPSGQWSITNTAFGDLKYQYLFTGANQKDIQIVLPPLVAPNPPEGLFASNITLNSFTVSWNPSATAISYRLDVSTLSDFSTFEQNFENLTVNGTSYSITGLTDSTTYYIRIRAVNTAGSSASSSPFQQETIGLKLSATNISETSFTVVWNNSLALLSPTSPVVYLLSVSTSSDFSTFIDNYDELEVLDTSQLISGLTAGTIYYVKVRATNQEGLDKISPTLIQITVPLAPEITVMENILLIDDKGEFVRNPRNPNFLENVFNISWTVSTGAQSYRLDIARDEDFTNLSVGYNNKLISGTTNLVNGLVSVNVTPGDNPDYGPYVYFARVRATNNQTENPVTSIDSTAQSQSSLVRGPLSITLKNFTENSVTLNWPEIPNATSYFIDMGTEFNFRGNIIKKNERVNGTEFIFTSFPSTRPYSYWARVRANNSNYSTPESVYTAPLAPSGVIISSSYPDALNYNIPNSAGLVYRVDISNTSDFNTFTSMVRRDYDRAGGSFRGLSPNTEYYLRAQAKYGQAYSLYSPVSEAFLTSPAIPDSPSLSLIDNSPGILVYWGASFGATGYLVEGRWGSNSIKINTIDSSIILSSLPSDELISVKVSALNSQYSRIVYSPTSSIRTRMGRITTLSSAYSPIGERYYPFGRPPFVPFRTPNRSPMFRWRFTAGRDWRATSYAYQTSENIDFSDNPTIFSQPASNVVYGVINNVRIWDIGIPLDMQDLGKTLYFRLYGVSREGILSVPATISSTFPL